MQLIFKRSFFAMLALLCSVGECRHPKVQLQFPQSTATSFMQVGRKTNLLAGSRKHASGSDALTELTDKAIADMASKAVADLTSTEGSDVTMLIDGKPAQKGQVHTTKTIFLNGRKISAESDASSDAASHSLQQQEGTSGSTSGDDPVQIDLHLNVKVVTDDCPKLSSREAFAEARRNPADSFNCYDGNGDGSLTPDEMQGMLKDMGSVVQDPSSYRSLADADKDGNLSQDEFTDFIIQICVDVDIDIQLGSA